jgi:hypothetical protein
MWVLAYESVNQQSTQTSIGYTRFAFHDLRVDEHKSPYKSSPPELPHNHQVVLNGADASKPSNHEEQEFRNNNDHLVPLDANF